MSLNLFPRRIQCLFPSLLLALNRSSSTTPLAFSTARTQAAPANPQFALDYLVQSCGLSSDEALKASKYIQYLKSPDKPDTVLQFLRQTGVSESDIRTAVSRDSRLLCSSVEKNLRPNIEKLREVGFSVEAISGIISRNPHLFRANLVQKVDFWLGVLGSVEDLFMILNSYGPILTYNLEKIVMPNLSFLREQCGLFPRQIARLVKKTPRVVSLNPEVLKMNAKRADELGFVRGSGMFMHALVIISQLSRQTFDARLNNFKRLGFSQDEIALLITKAPMLLGLKEEHIEKKLKFLIQVAGCDKIDVVITPVLLMFSLENRLIPRITVRKLLQQEEIPMHLTIANFMKLTEKRFVKKFVLPYEHAVPGLHQAYADAGKIGGID